MELTWRMDKPTTSQDTGATSSDADSDLEIISRARHDRRAFAPLYQRYSPAIYRYCHRRLGNTELAADATSIVFTRALAAVGTFRADPERPGSTVRSWLFAIAHNVVVDHHRRARHHRSLDNDVSTLDLPDSGPSPETHVVHSEARDRVRDLLATLPERQRQIVELRMAGLTGLDIAAALGMSHSAVKSAQFRAYASLRETVMRDSRGDHQ